MQDLLAELLENRKKFLEDLAARERRALERAPEGRVRCVSRNGKKMEYYHVTEKGSASGKYIHADNKELATALVQKSYDGDVLACAEAELACIYALEEQRNSWDLTQIYDQYGAARKELVTPAVLSDKDYVAQWLSREYENLGFEEDAPELYAQNGRRVRSKTEIFIADTLDKLVIPFLYEFPIYLNGYGKVYPDFLILNVRLRKAYIWEHLGMMDDPKYVARNLAKIEAYQKNGYFLGDNLILTFETKDHPFDRRQIEAIARHYFL